MNRAAGSTRIPQSASGGLSSQYQPASMAPRLPMSAGTASVHRVRPSPRPSRVHVKDVGASVFPLVAVLSWLHSSQSDGNMEICEVQAVPSSRDSRLECTVTTRQVPPEQPGNNTTDQSPTNLSCPP
jgi:hypothetical protein